MNLDLSAEQVRQRLEYDVATGIVRWLICPYRKHLIGKPAGSSRKDGYLGITIDGNPYLIHRIVWLHWYGTWPAQYVDHINGVRTDNRIANLREANATENSRNRRLPPHNTSGSKGVFISRNGRRFQARIGLNGRQVHIGNFASFEEARAAYEAAAAINFGEFDRSKAARTVSHREAQR